MNNSYLQIFPLTTYSGTVLSPIETADSYRGIYCEINVDYVSAGKVVFSIEGVNRYSSHTYTVLESNNIAASGNYSLSVYPGIHVENKVSKNSLLPYNWRVRAVADEGTTATFEVDATLVY